MWERLGVALFCLLVVLGSLGMAVWIVATGQIAYLDGIFLTLVFLVLALAFTLALWSMIKTAMLPASGTQQKAPSER